MVFYASNERVNEDEEIWVKHGDLYVIFWELDQWTAHGKMLALEWLSDEENRKLIPGLKKDYNVQHFKLPAFGLALEPYDEYDLKVEI